MAIETLHHLDQETLWIIHLLGLTALAKVREGKKKQTNPFPRSVRRMVVELQGGICHRCSKKVKLEIHHRVPQGNGRNGGNSIENAVGLCSRCHQVEDTKALNSNYVYPQVHFLSIPDTF
jgi:5-methylcytosine-specific restriction endonuclease McrA